MHSFRSGVVVVALALLGLAPQEPANDAAMLQRAHQLAQPGEPHQRLAKLQGEWDVVVRTTPPGGAEQTDRGTVEGTTVLGGRYVSLDFKLHLRGGEVRGLQILGFDTLRQLYTASWRDDQSTWSIECTGAAAANSPDLLQFQGTLVDARDTTGRPFRLEIDLEVKDRVRVSIYDTHEGAQFLAQTQDWTRR
ncbi:MAG TPA: DUF1579 family protein [Planctomycetota bacterium]|nr:DUF1579 family protein [Planctomycetota bacterium]